MSTSNEVAAMSIEDTLRLALEALKKCEDALAEELSAWDIDPPLHHVQESHDLCGPAIKALEIALSEREAPAKQEQSTECVGEPVAFKIYLPKTPRQDVNHGLLPWVYDQDPSSGNVASMWVTPVKNTPPQRTAAEGEDTRRAWVGLTDEDLANCDTEEYKTARYWEAKLKEKNSA